MVNLVLGSVRLDKKEQSTGFYLGLVLGFINVDVFNTKCILAGFFHVYADCAILITFAKDFVNFNANSFN